MYHQITSRKIHGTVTAGSWLGKFLLPAIVSAVVILLAPNLSLAQNATLTDDTHTNSLKPNKNFGTAETVQVRGTVHRGLLKFKLTPNLPPGTIGSHVGKATLKLFLGAVGAPGQIDVQRVLSAWTEQSATDATFPTIGAAEGVIAINSGGDGKWVTLDVTQLVKDWLDGVLPNNGVSLVASGGAGATFDSKENRGTSHEPRLEIVLNHAATADTASNAAQLGGVDAAQFIKGTDPRLTDSRQPSAGSANYIQNTKTPQAGADFNVSGNGTAAGTLSGNVVNATTQYNIGGQRILGNAGTRNLFAGVGTGTSNTNGFHNAFVGYQAGNANTTGHNNSFFGQSAGENNTEGAFNSFFGSGAGFLYQRFFQFIFRTRGWQAQRHGPRQLFLRPSSWFGEYERPGQFLFWSLGR
ncbi:MAG TPA: DNRLRE domain-containing protein [Pyrinomonadaceae bacterium]|nr:DNRLRE domain-containing protein [Pyrinomonadaceae bacterium]